MALFGPWQEMQRALTRREISRLQVIFVVIKSCAVAMGAATHHRSTSALIGFLGVRTAEEAIDGSCRGNGNVEEAEHHFFPALFAEANFGFRVRVVGVVGRVVKPASGLENCPGAQLDCLFQLVGQLPIEIVFVDLEQDLFLFTWLLNTHFEGFPAEVHVGEEAESVASLGISNFLMTG